MKTTGVEIAFFLQLHFEMLPQVSTFAIASTPTLTLACSRHTFDIIPSQFCIQFRYLLLGTLLSGKAIVLPLTLL
jgi:hypothetical protein